MKKLLSLAFLLLTGSTALAEGTHRGTIPGRFQLIQISEFRRDQFLLDTQTGDLWSRTCPKGDSCAWTRDLVEGKNIDHDRLWKVIQQMESQTPDKPAE